MSLPTEAANDDVDVEVRESAIHGRGVFARRALPADALIGRYAGRRYAPEEVEQREWAHALTYVFGISDGSVIDGHEGGNHTRYLNHSCAPNCIACEVEDEDGRLHIDIHALRPIAAGEELFLDYALDVGGNDPAAYPCSCGAPGCRGTLVGEEAA